MTFYSFACYRGTSFRSYRHSTLRRSGNLFRDAGAKTLTGHYRLFPRMGCMQKMQEQFSVRMTVQNLIRE